MGEFLFSDFEHLIDQIEDEDSILAMIDLLVQIHTGGLGCAELGCLLIRLPIPTSLVETLFTRLTEDTRRRLDSVHVSLIYRGEGPGSRLIELSESVDVDTADELQTFALNESPPPTATDCCYIWAYFDINTEEVAQLDLVARQQAVEKMRANFSGRLFLEVALNAVRVSGKQERESASGEQEQHVSNEQVLQSMPWLRETLTRLSGGSSNLAVSAAKLDELCAQPTSMALLLSAASSVTSGLDTSTLSASILPSPVAHPRNVAMTAPCSVAAMSRVAPADEAKGPAAPSGALVAPHASAKSYPGSSAAQQAARSVASTSAETCLLTGTEAQESCDDELTVAREALAMEAEALRKKLLRIAPAQAEAERLWTEVKGRPRLSARGPLFSEAADLSEFLKTRGYRLRLGEDTAGSASPLALFRVVARSAFGSEEHAGTLRNLCVRYAQLHDEKRTEQMVRALEQGHLMGTKWDLMCLARLLRIEIRQVKSKRRAHDTAEAHIVASQFKVPQELGVAETIVYVATVVGCEEQINFEEKVIKTMWMQYFTLEPIEELTSRPTGSKDDTESYYSSYEPPTASYINITIGDVEFSVPELEAGALTDEGDKLWLEWDTNGVPSVYREDRWGARQKLDIEVHESKVYDNWKRKANIPVSEEDDTNLPATEEDVELWRARFKEGRSGVGVASETLALFVLKLQDMFSRFKSELELYPANEADKLPILDRFGARVCKLLDQLHELKLNHFAQPASDRRPRVLVVGPEGVGKSFTINAIAHLEMKKDECFAQYRETAVLPNQQGQVVIKYKGDVIDMEAVRSAEALQWTEVDKVRLLVNNKKLFVPDILTTGNGFGAMTGIPNQIHLNPAATCMTLTIKYREKDVIRGVLLRAAKLQQQLRNDPEFDNFSPTLIHEALGLLGVKLNGTPDKQLREYKGEFKLLQHFESLLGRERHWRVQAPSAAAMAEELRKLLLLHTIGHWSRWPVIESVEIVLPSARVDLHLWDVPGFGDKLIDTYRQQIVAETMKKRCSTMLLLLDASREGGANAQVRPYLEAANVYYHLFGEEVSRNIGRIVTVKALDKIYGSVDLTSKEDIHNVAERAEELRSNSRKWMELLIRESMREQLQPLNNVSPDQRIERVVENRTEHYVVDVQGMFSRTGVCEDLNKEHLGQLVKALAANCDEAEQRRQRSFLMELVSTVLLPFYTLCHEVLQLKDFNSSNCGVSLPKLSWLKAFQEHTRTKLDRQSMMRSIRSECERFLSPMAKNCTPKAVQRRLETDPFKEYNELKTRALGAHLKLDHPEALPSKLRQLIVPDVTDQAALQGLADILRKHKKVLLINPLDELQDLLSKQIDEIDSRGLGGLLMDAIKPSLRKHVREMREWFSIWYDKQIETLPQRLDEKIRENMVEGSSSASSSFRVHTPFPDVAKMRSNNDKRERLASDAPLLASAVCSDAIAMMQQLLEPLHSERSTHGFIPSFYRVLERVHRQLEDCVNKNDISDLIQLDAFVVCQRYMRFCAGLVKALYESNLANECFADYPGLKEILEVASQPLGLLTKSPIDLFERDSQQEPSDELANDSPPLQSNALVPFSSETDTLATDDGWKCPSCHCPGKLVPKQKRKKLREEPDCEKMNTGLCDGWCIPVANELHCNLCVRWYIKRHARRSAAVERRRQRGRKRSLSSIQDDP